MQFPDDRRYSKEHLWALAEDDATVRVGITDFAQDELGEIVFVELPAVGAQVTQSKEMGQIESLKTVSDLYAPVSGEVIEVNAEVPKAPGLVNSDPYGKGWLVRVRCSNPNELASLLDAAGYQSTTS